MQGHPSSVFNSAYFGAGNLEVLAVGTCAVICAFGDSCVLKKFPTANRWYRRETAIYERLGPHENIATLLGFTNSGLVLERGECLRQVIQRRSPRNHDSQNLHWAIEAAKGLIHMHSKNVVHADVSPQNLILVDSKKVKWMDFEGSGIDDKPASASYEVYYWRPTATDPSADTDLFAFGCLLFEMETGRPPYSNLLDHLSLAEQVAQIMPLYSEGFFPDVEGLFFRDIISECWNLRFLDMDEVLAALYTLSGKPPLRIRAKNLWKGMVATLHVAFSPLGRAVPYVSAKATAGARALQRSFRCL